MELPLDGLDDEREAPHPATNDAVITKIPTTARTSESLPKC